MIAQRTKDALQAAKARGVVLGNPKLEAVRDRAIASLKIDADRFAKNVAPIIREIQSSGVASHRGIARTLNARGDCLISPQVPTPRPGSPAHS
jgi:DNA invertase Pin-like site-specific DNA recombinase